MNDAPVLWVGYRSATSALDESVRLSRRKSATAGREGRAPWNRY
jgi:hypothetical protein